MMRALKIIGMIILTLSLIVPGTFIIPRSAADNEPEIPAREEGDEFHITEGTTIPITENRKFNSSYYHPVPAGATVLSASMSVSVHPLTEGGRDYPEDVAINFAKGDREYEFNNEEIVFQGAWGRNYQTTDGMRFASVDTLAGASKLRFSIPKNATITSATIDINSSQRAKEFNVTNTTLVNTGGHFGEVIKVLGDTNGDNIDEVLVSAPHDNVGAGRVYHLSYPLPQLPTVPTVFASTTQTNAYFGTSISDVFQYPDNSRNAVAIGAPKDEFQNPGTVQVFSYTPGVTQISPDIEMVGNTSQEMFGADVETCDLDDDDHKEIFVGAPDSLGQKGSVYFFEVTSTSSTLITVLNGTEGELHFGRDMTVGDFNNDGVDDLAVASDDYVRLYLGGSDWDLIADATFDPLSDSGRSTFSKIEFLGDTGTGVETLGIGVPTSTAGSILLYDGGSEVDATLDLSLSPGKRIVGFGTSFSHGDMDNDDVNEIIVGAPGTSSTKGTVVVMKRSGSTVWKELEQRGSEGDRFGYAVGIANLRGPLLPDNDIFSDPIVGAPQFSGSSSTGAGIAYLFEYYDLDYLPDNTPSIKVGGNTVWTYENDNLNKTVSSGDLSGAIDTYIKNTAPDYSSDFEGFVFVDITFDSIASNDREGSSLFNLTNFDIRYEETVVFDELQANMNNFIENYDGSMEIINGQKFVPVTLSVSAKTPGKFMIESFDIEIDEVPFVENDPGEIHVPEDYSNDMVYDLYKVFEDNRTNDPYLNISVIVEGTKEKYMDAYIHNHRYLGIDLRNKTDDLGKNWSGEAQLIFTVKDDMNGTFIYTGINLVVDEVNDAPAITQMPSEFILQDSIFIYSPSMVDDEDDDINITLDFDNCPQNMTIAYETGTVSWKPNKWEVGFWNYTIILSDGKDERYYTFPLEVRNEPDAPVFMSPAPDPSTEVLLGTTFTYNFSAVDPDPGDRVTYIIVFPVQGAGIDVQTGLFSWTPPQHYPAPVEFVVRARDQDGLVTDLTFTLNTTFTDTPPFLAESPETELFDTEEWSFSVDVVDDEDHRIEIEIVESPEGMEYDDVTQNLTWTPDVDQIGDHNLSIKVTSTVFALFYNYTLEVERAERSWTFSIQGLEDGKTLKGKVQIGGELLLSPSNVRKVEVKVGDNNWTEGLFSEGRWSYDLDTERYDDGEYIIQVRAWDGAVYSDVETVTVKIKNEEEKTSPLIFVLIAVIILVVIGLVVGGFLLYRRREEKKQAEELERQRQEAIKASKKSMDEFIQETGAGLDQGVDYSQLELEDQSAGGENLEKIDEIFQPLNIPKEEMPDQEIEIPEDPLQKADVQEGPVMGESMQVEDIPSAGPPQSGDVPPPPPAVNLPEKDDE